MATLTCTNKGCCKTSSDSLLDEKSNEIICAECGKPISGITDFTKRSMKGMGHVTKNQAKSSFTVDCPNCQKKGQPNMKNNSPVCYNCGEPLHLTEQFLTMFREHIKNANNG